MLDAIGQKCLLTSASYSSIIVITSNNSNSRDNVYDPVIVAVNCHCESSFGQNSMSARRLPTFGPGH